MAAAVEAAEPEVEPPDDADAEVPEAVEFEDGVVTGVAVAAVLAAVDAAEEAVMAAETAAWVPVRGVVE